MIHGVEVREVKKILDERGFFTELMRNDWSEVFPEPLTQINFSYSYPGVIRAWHRHHKGQVDHFTVVDGSVKLCAFDDDKKSLTCGELDEFILSGESLKVVRIPGYLWHGFKAIGNTSAKLLYGVNVLYDYKAPDEERRPWNDPKLIPSSINGKVDDPRVGEPWDWNYPPHK
jgi:dTDP-4-dehydrorhamnose 3,5-epimerase